MDEKDEFFDDVNTTRKEEVPQPPLPPEQGNGRVPARRVSYKKWIIGIACVLGAVILTVLAFGGGMLVQWYSIDPQMRTLIKVKGAIDELYYKDVSDDEFYGALFATVNNELLDDYSEYMTAEEYKSALSSLAGNRSGIGVSLITESATGEEQMRISRVCGNSPAEEAGLATGEYIVGFGVSEEFMTESENYEEFSAFLAERAEEEYFYMKLRSGESFRTVSLCKRAYVENYVFYRTNEKAYTFSGEKALTPKQTDNVLSCLDDDTAYIRLVQFTGNASEAFDLAMEMFDTDEKKKLVLDLRGNGGGYLDVVQDIAKYFCKNATDSKPRAVTADYGNRKEYYLARGNLYNEYFTAESRIVVLADSGTASASECLIGCMKDYGTIDYADICLSERDSVAKTYGKGIMQTTYMVDLLKGDAIKLTTAEIRWPVTGYSIHARGVLPEDGTATVAESYEGDSEIENALKALAM